MGSVQYSISKTSFLKFEQCPKAFFFYKNLPYLRDKTDTDRQLTFRRGHEVGYLAQQLFPGGTDVSLLCDDAESAVLKTRELLNAGTSVIYEAAFVYRDVLVMVDILCRENDGYVAYEVKSSLKVSETYLKDACLQHYVISNALPELKDLFLVTISPDYILRGELDPKKLFRKRSVKTEALRNAAYFRFQSASAMRLLEANAIPNIPIGRQCFKPYQCDYFGVCWKDAIHEQSVFNLPSVDKGTLFDLHHSGIRNIEQVPDEILRKESLVKIKNAFILNEPIVNLQHIIRFVEKVKAPVVAMDMEIWSPAIPKIQGTGPYEQIPFLVSFFDGRTHSAFFTEEAGDHREEFARQLIALSAGAETLVVYDRTLEAGVLDKLGRQYPHLKKELEIVKHKMLDVFDVFLKMDYYHPGFKNNFSLKAVSAQLLKDLSYTGIGSGLEAMSYYEQYLGSANDLEKAGFRAELEQYCNTDTEATMGLLHFLQHLVK